MCGDGTIDDGEVCDDGAGNGPGMACKADCTANTCGDGDAGPGEACGSDNGDMNACTADCMSKVCGDGLLGPGEGCDDGTQTDDDACSNTCKLASCGDGVPGSGEGCDDGNKVDIDACTSACTVAACGDSFVFAEPEACDAGPDNGAGKACNAMCQLNVCDDGDPGPGEGCDGNVTPGDGCRATCQLELMTCGNGQSNQGERCDPGLPPPFTGVACKAGTCTYDLSQVPQLYCNGGCTWAGDQDCDHVDADIFCKLKTGNPNRSAMSFQVTTARDTFGFSCPLGLGTNLGPLPEYGVNVNVWYQGTSILANHGPGNVIVDVNCTNP